MAIYSPAATPRSGVKAGTGSSKDYSQYLKREYSTDKEGVRHPRKTEEISGNIENVNLVTEHLMKAKYRFVPAVIGLTLEESKRLSDKDIQSMAVSYAEHLAEPLDLSRVPHSIQKHTDLETGRIDLHVTLARYDLKTGKTFQPFVANREPKKTREEFGDMKRLQLFQDSQTITFGLDDPRHISRKELTKVAKNLPKDKEKIVNQVNGILEDLLTEGEINNRNDITSTLHQMGFETPRVGKDYITIKTATMANGIRLKGDMFNESFTGITGLREAAASTQKSSNIDQQESLSRIQNELQKINVERAKHFNKFTEINNKSPEAMVHDTTTHRNHNNITRSDIRQLDSEGVHESREPNTEQSSVLREGRPHLYPSPRSKHKEPDQQRNMGAGEIKKNHNIKIIDYCDFNPANNRWFYRDFPNWYVEDRGDHIACNGSQSEWKMTAALAAAKGWDGVTITARNEASARIAVEQHLKFNVGISSMKIAGEAMDQDHLNNIIKEISSELRQQKSNDQGLSEDVRKIRGAGEGKPRTTELCSDIDRLCGDLQDGERELERTGNILSKSTDILAQAEQQQRESEASRAEQEHLKRISEIGPKINKGKGFRR